MEMDNEKNHDSRVGLIYDERMCEHSTPNGEPHPENPNRIKAIWEKLESAGIPQRCVVMKAKEAEDRIIELVHTQNHIDLVKNISSKSNSRRNRTASTFNSIYFNEGSSQSAYLAAGSVIEVSERVAEGELDSAVAIVRPPGHHAETNEAMGFCLFNNVAIAASFLLNERPELGVRKIMIVDWDVHHGNGTQKMFWKDPRVLFFSIHRYDSGTFYPSGDDGSYHMVGEGPGAGYNINVPWEHGGCGDADYFAVVNHLLIPIAKAFSPDLIIISGGFDAAMGDPLGGCRITPYGYSVMMKKLMAFARGRIVMALEGGYNLDSLASSVLACVEMLLEDKPVVSLEAYPFESTWRIIQKVRQKLSPFWPVLSEELSQSLLLKYSSQVELITSSDSDGECVEENTDSEFHDGENIVERNADSESKEARAAKTSELDIEGVIGPLSLLKLDGDNHDEGPMLDEMVLWRPVLSKVFIWYGCFGSNMWKPRFLCYIEGGQVEGMQSRCCGSLDRTPPKEIKWKTVSHRLFFGRSHTRTWGTGGVAFLHPESSSLTRAYMCLYKITLEQFNDVLAQENGQIQPATYPLFDLVALNSVVKSSRNNLEILKDGWYSNVVCLGTDGNLPILTMTCPLSDIERFKSGLLPASAPCQKYMSTLVKGLTEGGHLSEQEAVAYVNENSVKPL